MNWGFVVYNLHQKNGRPGIGGLDVLRQKKTANNNYIKNINYILYKIDIYIKYSKVFYYINISIQYF